jgi:hypothetical protein
MFRVSNFRISISIIRFEYCRRYNINMGHKSAVKSCLNFGNGSKDSRGHTFTTSSKSTKSSLPQTVRNEWIQAVLYYPEEQSPTERSSTEKYVANLGVCSNLQTLPSFRLREWNSECRTSKSRCCSSTRA